MKLVLGLLLSVLSINVVYASSGSALNRCSVVSAMATGASDRSTGRNTNSNYYNTCRRFSRTELERAYLRGYQNGKSHHRRRHNRHETMCLTNLRDQKVCGYHCVKNNFGNVACAKKFKENCAMNDFGRIKCGMHCSVNPDTTVTCQSESASVQ